MRDLRTNTATRVCVGPFIDVTDFKTPETALTVTSEKLTFVVDDAGVPTLVLDVAPTASGGANDMVHITGDDSGFYDLELAAANVNYLGRAIMSINDVATHLPVFHEFMILSAEEYDAKYATTGPLETRGVIDRGTAQGGGTDATHIQLRAAAVFADDTVIGATVAAYGSTQGYWQTRTVTDYVLSTDTATVDTWTVTPSGTITYVLFAGPPASTTLIPAVNATQFAGQTITAAAGVTLPSSVASPTNITAGTITTATNVTTVNGLAANVITAAATAADFTTEIQSGLATAAALTTVDDFLDTEIAAIKAKTDSLTFTVANQLDANVLAIDGDTTTSIAESTAVPSASAGFMEKFRWLFTLSRNKITQTATTQLLKADDGSTTVGTSTVSDDGTTATRNEWT